MPSFASELLPNRGQCTQNTTCNCDAALFGPFYRKNPLNATELCGCGHAWWMHTVIIPSTTGPGGCHSTGCGGYYPTGEGAHPTPCVCGKRYDLHEQPVSAPPEPNTSAVIARSPPARAYANVANAPSLRWNPSSSTANEVNRQRTDAASRHRPPKPRSRTQMSQAAPEIPPPSSTIIEEYHCAVWPFVLDKSYSYDGYLPPKPIFTVRHFGETVEHLAKNNLVFSLTIDQHSSEPWKIIDRSLHDHLSIHRFEITRREGDDGNSFNSLSWDVLGQAKKNKDRFDFKSGLVGLADFTTEFLSRQALDVPIYPDRPKVPCLLLAPTHGNIRGPINNGPLAHACMPWRLLARYKWLDFKTNKDGNECIPDECPSDDERPVPPPSIAVRRARSPSSPPHQRNVRQRQNRRNSPNDTDYEDEVRLPRPRYANMGPRRQHRWVSPESDSDNEVEIVDPPRVHRQEINEMEVDRVTSVGDEEVEVQSPTFPNLSREISDFGLQTIDDVKLPRLKNAREWRQRIRAQSGEHKFSIKAPNTNAAAAVFIGMLKALHSGGRPGDYQVDLPMKCKISSEKALLSPVRPFSIGNGKFRTTAVGDGPTNSVFQGALDIRLECKSRWLPFLGGAYRSLNFSHPSGTLPTPGKIDLKVDGSLTALVMIQLLLEPYPVNPFLVYAALFEKPECLDFLLRPYRDYKPEHLLAMMPDGEQGLVAALIAHNRYQTFTESEVINDPLLIRFIMAPEKSVPISTFNGPREPDQHSTMVRRLLSELLIGHGSAWEQDQFQAFSSGLRLEICNVDDIVKPRSREETQNDIYLYAFKLVATLWNNRIESYSDVFDRISFSCVYKLVHEEKALLYAQLFLLRLHRWMKGQGHPGALVGSIVCDEDNLKGSKSPHTTRAILFWKALTDTVTLPAKPTKDVTVRLKYMPSLLPSKMRPPFYISVCVKKMEITLDPEVMNLLLEPGSMTDTADTAFDIWLHTALVTSANDYNAL